jgi:DNA-binding LacI/PurR family transcriptional regulator
LRLGVEHLADLGHRRIAHIDGGDSLISTSRREAYFSAMRDRGLERYSRVITGGENQLAGQRAAHELLRSNRALPTAVICFNDEIAVAAMGVLHQNGIDIPRQISVIGYDDTAMAGEAGTDLTTIAQQPGELARLAVERLNDRLQSKEIGRREIVLEPTLTVRSTTAKLSGSRTKK